MKTLSIILTVLGSLLQVADGISTYLCLRRPDRTEANGILKSLFDAIGLVPGLILVKGIGIAICVVAYLFAGIYTTYLLGALCIGYAWVLWNNYKLI